MKLTFTLKEINPEDFIVNIVKPRNDQKKTKFDVYNPGKISHVSRSGGIIRVLSRGNLYNDDGSEYNIKCNKPCWWHRESFDGVSMGIPIRIVENNIYMDGYFCSFSCVLAFLIDHNDKMIHKRNPNYKNSIHLLKFLFSKQCPNEDLSPTKDWRLLKTVGNGTMTIKDLILNLKSVKIREHPNLIYQPVTCNYDIL